MKLKLIQDSIVAALADVTSLPVIAEDQADVAAKLDAAVASSCAAVLVQTPAFRVTSNASKVMVGIVSVVVQAIERVHLARSSGSPSAQDSAESIAAFLNLLPIQDAGTLVCKSIESSMLNPSTLAYAVSFDLQSTIP